MSTTPRSGRARSCGRRQYGFEERLEVDQGEGHFATHFVITMQRVTSTA